MTFAVELRTRRVRGNEHVTEWAAAGRYGKVRVSPRPDASPAICAELLALHAVMALARPFGIRHWREGIAIRVSFPEIVEAVADPSAKRALQPYLKFLRLAHADLPVGANAASLQQPPSDAHVEEMTLLACDPWEDVVWFPPGIPSAPTFRALERAGELLRTGTRWKAWSAIAQSASQSVRLPDRRPPSSQQDVADYVCPRRGWKFRLKDGRIIDILESSEADRAGLLFAYVAMAQDAPRAAGAAAALLAVKAARTHVERMRILDRFVWNIPESERNILTGAHAAEVVDGIEAVLIAALDAEVLPASRAALLRVFMQALPESDASLEMPNGVRAKMTGHAIDRMMVRFSVRRPVKAMLLLRKAAGNLQPARLPAAAVVRTLVGYDAPADHWVTPTGWTLVVTEASIATVYFPQTRRTGKR